MKRTVLSVLAFGVLLAMASSAFAQARRQGPPPEGERGQMRGDGIGRMLRDLPDEKRRAVLEKLRNATPEERRALMEKFRNATPEQRAAWLEGTGGEKGSPQKKQRARKAPPSAAREKPARRPAEGDWLARVPQEEWERILERLKKVKPQDRAAVVGRFANRRPGNERKERMRRMRRGQDGARKEMMQRGGRGMGRQGHPMMQRFGRGMGRQGHPMMQRFGRGMGRQGHPMMQRQKSRGGGCPHCGNHGEMQMRGGGKKAPRRPRPPVLPAAADAGWFAQ